jgi:hypothetical protein
MIPERIAMAASRKATPVVYAQKYGPGGIHFGTILAVSGIAKK